MKKIVEIPMQDGGVIRAEVDEPEIDFGNLEFAPRDPGTSRIASTFEETLQALRPAIARIRRTLDEMSSPSEVELKFGIKLTGEAGVVFSSISTEGNFEVTLKWDRKGDRESDGVESTRDDSTQTSAT